MKVIKQVQVNIKMNNLKYRMYNSPVMSIW